MTAAAFRRIALGLRDAVESAHMGHPDFRVNNRIFATLSADHQQGMVKLTPAQQEEYLRAHPDVFHPASGAWGRQGCTMVRLSSADADIVGEAMTLAWQSAAAQPEPRRRKAARAKITRPPRRPVR